MTSRKVPKSTLRKDMLIRQDCEILDIPRKDTASHSHLSLEIHVPQIATDSHILSPHQDPRLDETDEADLLDVDDLYRWEVE